MTDKEYDKAKEECWKAVKKELDLHYWGGPTLDIVSLTFDRAYALGKQEKDAEDDRTLKVNRQLFCRLCADADDYINEHLEEEDGGYAYYQGRSDALHELYRGECKDSEDTVISGWVARGLDGEVFLYENKPERGAGEWLGRISSELDFQQLKWDSDPIELELIIKRKKK